MANNWKVLTLPGKCKLKPQQDTTNHPPEGLNLRQFPSSASGAVGTLMHYCVYKKIHIDRTTLENSLTAFAQTAHPVVHEFTPNMCRCAPRDVFKDVLRIRTPNEHKLEQSQCSSTAEGKGTVM